MARGGHYILSWYTTAGSWGTIHGPLLPLQEADEEAHAFQKLRSERNCNWNLITSACMCTCTKVVPLQLLSASRCLCQMQASAAWPPEKQRCAMSKGHVSLLRCRPCMSRLISSSQILRALTNQASAHATQGELQSQRDGRRVGKHILSQQRTLARESDTGEDASPGLLFKVQLCKKMCLNLSCSTCLCICAVLCC